MAVSGSLSQGTCQNHFPSKQIGGNNQKRQPWILAKLLDRIRKELLEQTLGVQGSLTWSPDSKSFVADGTLTSVTYFESLSN